MTGLNDLRIREGANAAIGQADSEVVANLLARVDGARASVAHGSRSHGHFAEPVERRRSESRAAWTGPERRESWSLRDDDHLLSDIGGEEVIRKVHQAFYDRLFKDPWLGQCFYGKSKEVLVRKQTQFMVSAFGGPYIYRGDTPAIVHMNMFITDELAALRERFLRRAILSQGLSESIADRWQAVDRLYRPSVVKQSVDDCVVTCFGQFPVEAKKPADYKEPEDLQLGDQSNQSNQSNQSKNAA